MNPNPKAESRNPNGVPPWPPAGESPSRRFFSDFGFRISDFRHNGTEVAVGH